MKKILVYGLLLLLVSSILFSCDLKDNEVLPDQRFLHIYETGTFDRAYVPIDVQQTSDGGYLLLAGATVTDSDFLAAYLMKVDKEGKVEWEHLSERFVNPVSDLFAGLEGGAAGVYTFVGMDKQQLGTHIIQVNTAGEQNAEPTSAAYFGVFSYPLAAHPVSGGFAILHWDRENKSSMQLSRTRGTAEQWTKKYDIYEDVEAMMMAHLTRQRQPLVPFRVGILAGGQLYFNGYNNYTLSLTFVNGNTGEQTGIVNGTRYASGVSQILPLHNGKFAVSRYLESGENLYAPAVDLAHNGIATVKDLPGNQLPELIPYAPVKIRQEEVLSEAITFYASDTRNGQICLFAYDANGVLRGTTYLGAGNRFETGSIRISSDGGLVIFGRTFVAGRFPRLCLFKLSPQEVKELVAL